MANQAIMSLRTSTLEKMRLIEIRYGEALLIDSYGPGFFRMGPHVLQGASLITPWDAGPWGGYADVAALLSMKGSVDVMLIGTGREISFIPKVFQAELEAAGIGLDVMPTAAACRTYNILLGEGRRIAAAMLPFAQA